MQNNEFNAVQNLYNKFSNDPYVPGSSWTTSTEFTSQQFKLVKTFVEDPTATESEFVEQQIPKI